MSMYWITDQPGRLLAVFVLGPALIWKAHAYQDTFIMLFASMLIVWDAWWLFFKEPHKMQSHLQKSSA